MKEQGKNMSFIMGRRSSLESLNPIFNERETKMKTTCAQAHLAAALVCAMPVTTTHALMAQAKVICYESEARTKNL